MIIPWAEFYNRWDLDGASHVRVVAHYVYGDHARDLLKVPPVLHSMPSYALTSNAMELAIDPPITLELTWKGTLPRPGQALSASVEVIAFNRGKTALPFATADTGPVSHSSWKGRSAMGRRDVTSSRQARARPARTRRDDSVRVSA